MSTFKDILDTISGLEGELVQNIICSKQHHSISKSAQDGILDFPVIVSDTLSVEDAMLVNKALEKQYASFVLTVMTMNPYLYGGSNPNAARYVKQFHQNMDTRADGTDLINTVNSFIAEAANKFDMDYSVLEGVRTQIIACVYENVNYDKLNMEHAKFNYTIDEVTDPTILNSKFCRRYNFGIATEGNGPRGRRPRGAGTNITTIDQSHASINQNEEYQIDDMRNTFHTTVNVRGDYVGSGGGGRTRRGNGGVTFKDAKLLTDNDAKKANELVPTLIHMRIYPVDKMTDIELDPIDFVLGVKATLHPVSSDEMIVNIARGIKNENTFFNFIRWTTGEIKFFKDFLFCINELKIDAINTGNRASHWWTTLKRRRALARIKNTVLPNKLLPNATIVITQEEIDILKNQYGYDLTQVHLAYELMKNYFLLAFVIVDPALQRVTFLFDGKDEQEVQTYATLAKESTTNDRQFKEMINMLGRRI